MAVQMDPTTAIPSGGNGTYVSYLWSNIQTTATATGLSTGTYTVTVTDGLGCTANNSVNTLQPALLIYQVVQLAFPMLPVRGKWVSFRKRFRWYFAIYRNRNI